VQNGNRFGDDGAKSIAQALKENSSLLHLSLVRTSAIIFVLPHVFVVHFYCICSPAVFARVYVYFSLKASQSGNNVSVAATCRLISCTLQNPNLTQLYLDHEPSSCIGHDAWRSEALPVPHDDVAAQGWTAVLEYLRKVSMPICFEVPPIAIGL
jgi:hypothetical protein